MQVFLCSWNNAFLCICLLAWQKNVIIYIHRKTTLVLCVRAVNRYWLFGFLILEDIKTEEWKSATSSEGDECISGLTSMQWFRISFFFNFCLLLVYFSFSGTKVSFCSWQSVGRWRGSFGFQAYVFPVMAGQGLLSGAVLSNRGAFVPHVRNGVNGSTVCPGQNSCFYSDLSRHSSFPHLLQSSAGRQQRVVEKGWVGVGRMGFLVWSPAVYLTGCNPHATKQHSQEYFAGYRARVIVIMILIVTTVTGMANMHWVFKTSTYTVAFHMSSPTLTKTDSIFCNFASVCPI